MTTTTHAELVVALDVALAERDEAQALLADLRLLAGGRVAELTAKVAELEVRLAMAEDLEFRLGEIDGLVLEARAETARRAVQVEKLAGAAIELASIARSDRYNGADFSHLEGVPQRHGVRALVMELMGLDPTDFQAWARVRDELSMKARKGSWHLE